jgi:hypothetical protein
MNLTEMRPHDDLSSTTYCLAHPGREYLVYQPNPDTAFTVTLPKGRYDLEARRWSPDMRNAGCRTSPSPICG